MKMEKNLNESEVREMNVEHVSVNEDELPLPLVDVMNSSQFTFSPDQNFLYYNPVTKLCLVTHFPLRYDVDLFENWRPVDLIYPQCVKRSDDADSLVDFSDMAPVIDMGIRKQYLNFINNYLKNYEGRE